MWNWGWIGNMLTCEIEEKLSDFDVFWMVVQVNWNRGWIGLLELWFIALL
jgi:hypothetical protein